MLFFRTPRSHTVALFLALAAAVAPLCSIAAAQSLLALSFAGLLVVREPLRLPPVKLPLLVFLTGTLISLLLSGHIREGWPQIRKFYLWVLVLVSVATAVRRIASLVSLVLWWAAAGAASAVWGLVQFARTLAEAQRTGDNLYHALVAHRITGFMSLWMTFSGQLMVVLLMVGALVVFSREGRRRSLLLAPCAALMFAGLVLALTRGPWIGAAAGLIYLLWQWNRKSLLALPVLAALAFLAAPATLRDRAGSIVKPGSELDSNRHRIVLWRTGLEMVKAHPWFGIGPEQVDKQFASYIPADIPRPLPFGWYRHLHNIYLQTAAERGIPVLLALLWFVGKALRDFLRAAGSRPPGPDLAKALLHGFTASLIAFLVAGFFEHSLGDSEMLQLFLTLIAGGYAAVTETDREPSAAQPIPAA